MDRSNKLRSRRDRKGKKAPKVPIKTYRWEDIRRARRRGGYPWTHLYKGPFTEKIDPEPFTMDAFRRSKSSSPMGKRSDRIEISEVSSWADYSGKTTPTLLQELISEPQEDTSTKNSRAGSVVIEEYVEDDDKDLEDDVQVREFQTESVDTSSDNISQYVDKEDRVTATSKTIEEAKRLTTDTSEDINDREKRAKSEDTGQRKRKLSAESSHSRYSLSKLGVMKRLKEAKNKIKVPKLSFPTKKNRSSPPKEDKPKKENKKFPELSSKPRKPDKPVYIHIPLKPPPGETDEFSHLEFEDKQENGKENKPIEEKSGEPASDNVNNEKMDVDEDCNDPPKEADKNNDVKDEKKMEKSPFSSLERGPRVTKRPPIKINPAFKQFLKDVRQLKDKELSETQAENTEEKDKAKESSLEQQLPIVEAPKPIGLEAKKTNRLEESSLEQKPSIVEAPKPDDLEAKTSTPEEETPTDLEESQTSESESPREDVFDKLFEASASKKDESSAETSAKKLLSEPSRGVRSKSAEPQAKRRSSMDSSYSRKSLSKLAIMKKLKNAGEKIKSAFSMDSLRKKVSKKEDEKETKKKEEETKKHKKPKPTSVIKPGQLDRPKVVEPVYIYIPLKPPEGKTDEFSHLANEPGTDSLAVTKKEERTDSLDSTSPISPGRNDVQFIFLTPPSDDELLDKESDIPETPSSSSDDIMFFGSLKKLAEDAVDQVSPETKKKTLETVCEESASDRSSPGEIEPVDSKESANEALKTDQKEAIKDTETTKSPESEEKTIVDVEDDLNETAKTEENLKSALKTAETSSPKRVSFKRKSKTVKDKDIDNGYEPIEPVKVEKPADVLPQTEENIADDKKIEVLKELDKEKDKEVKQQALSETLERKKDVLVTDVSQPMSPEEENGRLEQKTVKDSSLAEEYNKWLNMTGDHEYEPISPPPDEVTIMTSVLPTVTVVDEAGDPKVIISATEILDKPLEEKKKPFFQFGRFQKDKGDRDRGSSSETQSRSSQGRDLPESDQQPKPSEGPNKFQVAFKQRTEQLKTKTNELRSKIHNMKKPNIHMPKTPEFKKPQFKKPDFKKRFKIDLHLPKIPDTATIHLPHISLPGARKTTETRTIETRQFSTESNADDSEQQTKRHKFDLSFGGTFPRFRKKKKTEPEVAFGTVPRAKKETERKVEVVSSEGSGSIRIPLHSEDSMDAAERLDLEEAIEPIRSGYEDRETSADIAHSSGRRHSGDIAVDDEYERENQAINRVDYLSRWQHGNFRERQDDDDNEDELIVGRLVEQRFGRPGEGGYDRYEDRSDRIETLEERLRRDEERPRYIEDDEEEEFDMRLTRNKHMVTDLDNLEDEHAAQIREEYSSEGSGSLQRKGRLGKLDIDSDEFFVVHEIREGFQTPANALAQMNEYDPIGSNRSLPTQMRERQEPVKAERKSIKKPKRKKTPHVSQEEMPGDEESIEEAIAPSRPKRRSKRNKKKTDKDEIVVPYQETIPLATDMPHGQRLDFPRESLGILGDDERDDHEFEMYQNERMQGKEQPEVIITDPYKQFQMMEQRFREKEERPWPTGKQEEPSAPPRKHRSLKSLTQSENESILTDTRYEDDRHLDAAHLEDQIIQGHQMQTAPPRRPSRKSRSHTSSLSRVSLPPSQRDTDSVFTDESYLGETQQIPSYLIENQNYKQQIQAAIHEAPPYLQDDQERQPCVEEPCVQDLRDYMGYAIVDKTKPPREPPLPPPRTPPKRKKREVGGQEKFATVPRSVGLSHAQAAPPVRPVRNYSTLSHVRSSKKEASPYENGKENKENEGQSREYIEIEDEVTRDLVSGEVLQKMRQRPLPAPPRPPRKSKTTRRSLQDITSKDNIIPTPSDLEGKEPHLLEETVSTQTEPLPPDFICEEIRQEPTDTVITPRISDTKQTQGSDGTQREMTSEPTIQRFQMYDPRTQQRPEEGPQIRRELITPTVYSFEETVTHGTLLVQPIDGAKVVPDHQLSRERLVPLSREYSDEDEETSEVPESFGQLRSPEDGREEKRESQRSGKDVLKAEKLQVSDLDVDRLTVNELLASKIVVSEIDSSSISTNEIQGRGGTIKLGDIDLPTQLLEQLVRQLEVRGTPGEVSRPAASDQELLDSQKKTSIDSKPLPIPLDYSQETETPLDPLQQEEYSATLTPREPSPEELRTSKQPPLSHSRLPGDHPQGRESSVDSTSHDLSPEPPLPPPRSFTLEEGAPDAPPRTLRRKSKPDSPRLATEEPESVPLDPLRTEMMEPEVDDQPPPRPPQPMEGLYFPSQPPASFYALRAKQFVDENIPTAPRRKRHRSRPVSRSRSTSDDSSTAPHRPTRLPRRASEPSISELSGRLIQACSSRANNALKRLIYYLTENLLRNADGKQDLHVFMIILLVLIAGLILLGYGEDRTVVHLHHWEFFNPPKDI